MHAMALIGTETAAASGALVAAEYACPACHCRVLLRLDDQFPYSHVDLLEEGDSAVMHRAGRHEFYGLRMSPVLL